MNGNHRMMDYAPEKLEILYKILTLELLTQKAQSPKDHSNCSTMFHTINSKCKYFCSSRNLICMQNTRSLIPDTWSDKRNSLLSRPRKSSDILIALNGTEYFLKWRLMRARERDTALLVSARLPRSYKQALCRVPVEVCLITITPSVYVHVLKTSAEWDHFVYLLFPSPVSNAIPIYGSHCRG